MCDTKAGVRERPRSFNKCATCQGDGKVHGRFLQCDGFLVQNAREDYVGHLVSHERVAAEEEANLAGVGALEVFLAEVRLRNFGAYPLFK